MSVSRPSAVVAILALAAVASADELLVTGHGVVRRADVETRFALLISGDATSLSVERFRCANGECAMEHRWTFEGPLVRGPNPLHADFLRVYSVPASETGVVAPSPSALALRCHRVSPVRGTTRVSGRCRLVGPLPSGYTGERSFTLAR
jgi:hypothetical protein